MRFIKGCNMKEKEFAITLSLYHVGICYGFKRYVFIFRERK
jgi:hypothetical protein